MKQFYKEVDLQSKSAMRQFLREHFRYDTANAWNNSTSYANNIKIHKLGLPQDVESKAYELLEVSAVNARINLLIESWGTDHNYCWQAGFNGRSGGYLVLYQGGLEPSKYKSICTNCGQLNYQTTEKSNSCGRCCKETRIDLDQPIMGKITYTCRSTDQSEVFAGWSADDLRDRVQLVQSFDRLCDDIVAEIISICESYDVVEKEIFVSKIIKVLQEA